MATGAPIRPSKLHRRQFQELTAECFDRQAEAIANISAKVQAQGEFMADLAVARDTLQTDLRTLTNGYELRRDQLCDLSQHFVDFKNQSFWQRLRWVVTGR